MKIYDYARDGTVTVTDVPDIVPPSVTNFQARAALIEAGLFAAADAAAKAAGGVTAQAWDYANVFERQSPTIAALASGLKLTSAQVDALFIAAASKTA